MQSRPALAVSLHVAGLRCLVIGEGAIADERAARLVEAGSHPERVRAADYRAEGLDGASVVFCCDAALAPRVSADARAAGALFYAQDRPDLSDFSLPAVARRGPLTLAVATDGVAPALARRLREELERLLAGAPGELDELVAEMARIRATLPHGPERTEALGRLARRLTLDGKLRLS